MADAIGMGATLALGGVNPLTGERVVQEQTHRHVLAVMTTAGLYEDSGGWRYDVGLPGKSGIGGGIITVAPGKGGLATFPSHRRSTRRETACADSLPRGFCHAPSGSTSSCHVPMASSRHSCLRIGVERRAHPRR